MTNKEIKTPSLLDAMLPILALVIMMGSAVYLFADNSSYGPIGRRWVPKFSVNFGIS